MKPQFNMFGKTNSLRYNCHELREQYKVWFFSNIDHFKTV